MCLLITVHVFQSVLVIFLYVLISTTYDHVCIFIIFRSFLRAVPMCTYFCEVCMFYMKNSASVSCFKHNCLFDDFSKECFPKCRWLVGSLRENFLCHYGLFVPVRGGYKEMCDAVDLPSWQIVLCYWLWRVRGRRWSLQCVPCTWTRNNMYRSDTNLYNLLLLFLFVLELAQFHCSYVFCQRLKLLQF